VHGLQGHPRITWTRKFQARSQFTSGSKRQKLDKSAEEPTSIYWPADLLPEDCPRVRILTFGYESHVSRFFRGPADQNNVVEHGRDLLYALEMHRREKIASARPIIFVAHSLGGLLVKEVS
jgi:hypothetical protein